MTEASPAILAGDAGAAGGLLSPVGSGSWLPKAPTGTRGPDEITGGGLPRGRPTLVAGAAGCGKTLLGDVSETGTAHPAKTFLLRLDGAGQSPKCVRAVDNLTPLSEEHLAGRYRIELIDLTENPALAFGDEILAGPTLVRRLPPPLQKIISDLADRAGVGWAAAARASGRAAMTRIASPPVPPGVSGGDQ